MFESGIIDFNNGGASGSNVNRLRIDTSGHVGLGVLPNTNWPTNNDFKALQIGTGACVFGRGSGDEDRGGIAVNWYSDGSNNKYIGNGNAARIYLADGNIYFSTAGANSSGANAAMTLNDKMILSSSGRLGIAGFQHNYTMNSSSTDLVIGDGGGGRGITLWTASGADNQTISFQTNETLSRAEGEISYGPTGTSVTNNRNAMMFRTNSAERLRITKDGFVGIGEDDPQTKLDVRGTISTGRNVARELGTVINVSSNHDGSRVGANVINGNKNYEAGADWLAQGGSRVDANLTIDLGSSISCDRFVIYNQNEYNHSNREVKRFTLEGSNDNSSWTTILDDEAGCSNAHEPNPGWSFRIPSGLQDDDEGASWRYWRFTMKTFHQSDSYGGIMELELYEQTQTIQGTSEITTNSLVASDISAGTVRTCGQPSFLATASGNNINIGSGGTFPFNTEQYDRTGSYNTSTYQFTAPVTGEYFFFYQVYRNSSTSAEVAIYVNNDAKRRNRCNPNGGDFIFAQSTILRLDSGDVVDLRSYNGNMDNFYGSSSNQRESHFGGYLLG